MPDDRLEKARFVRVSKTGDLVFSLGGREMAVSVDDTLERAILEAKQVRSEMRQAPQPHQQSTLPISQIQSLIRAGADPARVAEKYHLSEMLVRRFSMAVETEKQYAIEQFLAVAAPKDSRVRTISELVERTLASAGIGMESVTWKSTDVDLSLGASCDIHFRGREIHAEWTWNMHDNSVMSLNNAARKLLGEQNPESATDSKLKPTIPELPGDSVRSARIERAVSAWAAPTPSIPAARPAAIRPSVTSTGSMPPVDLSTSISPATTQAHGTTAPSPVSSQTAGSVSPSAAGLQQSPATAPEQGSDNVSDKTIRSGPNAQLVATEQERAAESAATEHEAPAKPAKRKSGRSAVPSWDEILFGD